MPALRVGTMEESPGAMVIVIGTTMNARLKVKKLGFFCSSYFFLKFECPNEFI